MLFNTPIVRNCLENGYVNKYGCRRGFCGIFFNKLIGYKQSPYAHTHYIDWMQDILCLVLSQQTLTRVKMADDMFEM